MLNPRHRLSIRYLLWLALLIPCSLLAIHPHNDTPQSVYAQNNTFFTPIYAIQGRDAVSPYYQQWRDSYGVVTGVLDDGFYLQDPVGDDDPATSDGIFVYTYTPPTVQPGQCVEVTRAYVDEFYEKTELSRLKSATPSNRCPTLIIPAVTIPLPRLGTNPAELYEAYEGMLVTVTDLTGIVHGPTKHFATGQAELALLPRLWQRYLSGGRIFQQDQTAMQALVYVTNELGATLPEADWGATIRVGQVVSHSVVSPARGTTLVHSSLLPTQTLSATAILDYNFGKYQLHLLADTPITTTINRAVDTPGTTSPSSQKPEMGSAATAEDFTLCSFNLQGLGRGSAQYPDPQIYERHLAKRVRTIAESLQECTIIGLQETGTPQDAINLAELLQTAYQLDYEATALAGPGTQNGEFPLTNSLLTRRDRVQVRQATLPQGCSPQNYEVPTTGPVCPAGEYPLFDRPPLVVSLLVTGTWSTPFPLTVIVNHWKSKSGDESVNVVRRIDQAAAVATLIQAQQAVDPLAQVVVLGDLNDYRASEPLHTLQAGVTPPLLHLYDFLPSTEQYTYIFNGGSQVLDHVLVTPNLAPTIATVDLIRLNADYATATQTDLTQRQRASDHDPVQVRLRPDGAAILGGSLNYADIHVKLQDKNAEFVAETTTDAHGEFRFWNLIPGTYTVTVTPPPAVTIAPAELSLDLPTGYSVLPTIASTHRVAKLGVALVLTTPSVTHLAIIHRDSRHN
ncbi:MAG: endonuclease/exonuclease/phosphatase family protein [Caldilineaceae bacterium]|nr:endonuclease/exonuclease/phosphatase family protein [Caldilineaceae bacterium]